MLVPVLANGIKHHSAERRLRRQDLPRIPASIPKSKKCCDAETSPENSRCQTQSECVHFRFAEHLSGSHDYKNHPNDKLLKAQTNKVKIKIESSPKATPLSSYKKLLIRPSTERLKYKSSHPISISSTIWDANARAL